MRHVNLAAVALLSMTTLAALAQAPDLDPGNVWPDDEPGISLARSANPTNIDTTGTQSPIVSTLPTSSAGANMAAHEYLTAARAALVAGRTGEAQQSLAMAATSVARAVVLGQETAPDPSRFIVRIGAAWRALGDGERAHAIAFIDLALSS